MTDAREIIAHQIPGSSAEVCFGLADDIIAGLTSAGHRILGPDEVAAGDELVAALKRYGFPVSDAAEPSLMEGGSREAKALHKAAEAFIAGRQALATSKGGER